MEGVGEVDAFLAIGGDGDGHHRRVERAGFDRGQEVRERPFLSDEVDVERRCQLAPEVDAEAVPVAGAVLGIDLSASALVKQSVTPETPANGAL